MRQRAVLVGWLGVTQIILALLAEHYQAAFWMTSVFCYAFLAGLLWERGKPHSG